MRNRAWGFLEHLISAHEFVTPCLEDITPPCGEEESPVNSDEEVRRPVDSLNPEIESGVMYLGSGSVISLQNAPVQDKNTVDLLGDLEFGKT